MVCMHCEDPTCAEVCPADAIKQNEDGIVQSALKPRCIGCSNCVLACPFGVPKMIAEFDQMMKCDMCTDRTSKGSRRCARRCARARRCGTARSRSSRDTRRGSLLRDFLFGRQEVRTKVYTVVDDLAAGPIDVLGRRDDDLARRPVRPRRGGAVTDDRRTPVRCGGATSRTRRPPRTRSPGASSPATSCSAPARWPPATSARRVDPAAHDQHRRAASRSSPSPTSRSARRYLFRYPTDDDPAILLRLADREVVAFSQKCTHLGCVVYFEADDDRWHCPCHEGNFDDPHRRGHLRPAAATARPHRGRDPRRRPDLGARAGPE